VVWFSAITFGLIHIGNFELVKVSQYLIVPLLVLPQLGTGFVLSYVRLTYKNGFLICLLVHMLINFVPATMFLFQN
jgi:membrane protease YdiL (CAAX protease family)